MPTLDRSRAISEDEARERAGHMAFPPPCVCCPTPGRIGLEPELFAIRRDEAGRPVGRVPLTRPDGSGVLEIVDALGAEAPRIGRRHGLSPGPWEFRLAGGGRITFEPGGQVEHSTAVHTTGAGALADVDRTIGSLKKAFRDRGAVLASVGTDLWHSVDDVPQQLEAGRYVAQADYYERRGRWGAVMMRHTASLQLNLDLGPEGVWQERWLLANLLSPLITATFSSSPGDGVACLRARAWQELDPTRSGFSRLLLEGNGDDPRAEWAEAALEADVMLFRLGEHRWLTGHPGYRFVDWIREGRDSVGWPTGEDLDYHLTTLFFEVRPRGFLELRGGEALPDPWRAAEVALITAAVYDQSARERILATLTPVRPRLDELWRRAAADGLADAELAELAGRVWPAALEATGRLEGYLGADAVRAAGEFLERYTARGENPGDELRRLYAEDPALALAWASSEPATVRAATGTTG